VKKLLAVIFAVATAMAANAQEEPEYKMEIGAGAGMVSYVGDYNGNPLKGMQPWLALVAKYRLDPRVAIAFDLGTGKLKGKADNGTYEFKHNLTEADVRLEYNFWPYGTGYEYRGAQRFTPFITMGLGASLYGGPEKGATMNLPIGAGVKYKIGNRLNLTAEWAMRFTLSDKLDGSKDPLGIKSSGLFKNTDGYSVLQIALTYDLWEKCKTCNNDRY
jgi:hypothetical protein